MRVENDRIICESCGFSVRINEYYDLVDVNGKGCPKDIDKWYKWQRKSVANRITEEGFELCLEGSLCTVRLDKLKKPPKDRKVLSDGGARLTKEGLYFFGTLDGERVDFDFCAQSLYSLTFSTEGFL